jgi:tetratricopeptide (TPR) repeat protein
MLLFSLPVVIIALIIAVKLISLSAITTVALTLYDRSDFEGSADQSSRLLDQNVIEPYIPYFNRGDAKAADEDYTGAIDDFEKALELAPADRKCQVVVNLAHSWELLGDIYEQGGYHQGAVLLYQAAEDVIAAAGDDCEAPDPAADELDQIEGDVGEKKQAAEDARDEQDATEPGAQSDDEKLDDLGDKQDQSDQDKANGDSREQGEDSDGDTYTDKPW